MRTRRLKDTDGVQTWADPIRGEYKEAVYIEYAA
jgi:hypothetical protein